MNKPNPNLKLLPFVTAICVLVFATVSCRNVMLEQKLRNPNKGAQGSIFPDAYYVSKNGSDDNDGIAYSTPFKQLRTALDAVKASGGKVNRVIVIGTLKSANADGLTWVGDPTNQHSRDTFFLENYGTEENPIIISGTSGGTLEAATEKRVIGIGNNSHLKFENITLKDGAIATGGADCQGGGLYIEGNSNVTLLNGARIFGNKIDSNSATAMGGGIYVENGSLTIDGAEITKNEATGSMTKGGGLYAGSNAKVTIKSGVFTVNKTDYSGAGVYIASNASFTMTGGTISANTARRGGGIFSESSGTIQINGGTIYRNTASGNNNNTYSGGGGIYIDSGTVQIRGVKILSNSATGVSFGRGGGVHLSGNGSSFTMTGGTISANAAASSSGADRGGGGVFVAGNATFTMTGGTVSANNSGRNGGGIFIGGDASFVISGTANVQDNTATFGGGIYLNDNTTGGIQINGGFIRSNKATGNSGGGGGICSTSSTWTLDGAEIKDNEAGKYGGGIYLSGGTLTYTSGTIVNNTATSNGASVYRTQSPVGIVNGISLTYIASIPAWYTDVSPITAPSQ